MTEAPTDLARDAYVKAFANGTFGEQADAVIVLCRATLSEGSNGLDEKIRHIIGDMFAASLPEITVPPEEVARGWNDELRATAGKAREALCSAPRPGTGDSDLVAYMDWYFQVRGKAIAELDALSGKGE